MFSESLATVRNDPGIYNRSDLRQRAWDKTACYFFSQTKKPAVILFSMH